MKILIKNGRVIDPATNFDEVCDVAIAAGRIIGIRKLPADFSPNKVIDASGCIVAPGPGGFVGTAARAGPRTRRHARKRDGRGGGRWRD